MKTRFLAWTALLVLATGCGVQPVTGGTPGTLRAGGQPLGEVQIIVFQQQGDAAVQVGLGVTALDGTFELVANEARGPLVLAPGQYVCTLESVGAPLQFQPAYSQAQSSPLRVQWSSGSLDLDIPPEALGPPS